MKYDALKKHGNQWVKLRPAFQIYNDSGVLTETVDDAWYLAEVSEDGAKIQNQATGHVKHVGLDHIHHYMSEKDTVLKTTGTLVMNVQLLVHEGDLLTEPVSAPGQALKSFVRAKPRANLMTAASRMRAKAELERARKEFAWSESAVRASDDAFRQFAPAFEALRDELSAAGQPVGVTVKRHPMWNALLVGAAGWWVSLGWTRLAANCLDGSLMSVVRWNGHPQWPGHGVWWKDANQVQKDDYTFGLVALGEARWVSESNPELSYTTVDLAQEILTRLFEQPNQQQQF